MMSLSLGKSCCCFLSLPLTCGYVPLRSTIRPASPLHNLHQPRHRNQNRRPRFIQTHCSQPSALASASAPLPHNPVLVQEATDLLFPSTSNPPRIIIDCTVGAGGHALHFLRKYSSSLTHYIALDKDTSALHLARETLSAYAEIVHFAHADFRNVCDVSSSITTLPADAVLLDAGVSSMQLDEAGRGFSHSKSGPLDMRMDSTDDKLTAWTVLNEFDEERLANIIYTLGEERASRRIANALMEARPLQTTQQVSDIILSVKAWRKKGIHPATQTFQAIRMYVNSELDALNEAIPQMVQLLKPRGRVGVISFHSLEDRVVKRCFKELTTVPGGVRLVNNKVVCASDVEVNMNVRARSAKLRVAERVTAGEIGKKVGLNKYAREARTIE